MAGDKDCHHIAGVTAKPGLQLINGWCGQDLSPAFSGEEEPAAILSLQRQGLDQVEGKSPTGGKLHVVRRRRIARRLGTWPFLWTLPWAALGEDAGSVHFHGFAIQHYGRECQSQIARFARLGDSGSHDPARDLGSAGCESLSLNHDWLFQYCLELISQVGMHARHRRLQTDHDRLTGWDRGRSKCLGGRDSITAGGTVKRKRALGLLRRSQEAGLTGAGRLQKQCEPQKYPRPSPRPPHDMILPCHPPQRQVARQMPSSGPEGSMVYECQNMAYGSLFTVIGALTRHSLAPNMVAHGASTSAIISKK